MRRVPSADCPLVSQRHRRSRDGSIAGVSSRAWTARGCVGALLAGALAFAGCGAKSTPAQTLSACLRDKAGASSVMMITTALPGAPRNGPRASRAFLFTTGGPTNQNGKITDVPTNDQQIYVFADAAMARTAAAIARVAVARAALVKARHASAGGNPGAQPGVTSAAALGRSVLVYMAGTAFGSGLPITADELNAVHTCIDSSGYG